LHLVAFRVLMFWSFYTTLGLSLLIPRRACFLFVRPSCSSVGARRLAPAGVLGLPRFLILVPLVGPALMAGGVRDWVFELCMSKTQYYNG